MNLILSLIALALGPLLYGVLRKADAVRSSLDGFLFVTIAGIVIVYIVPDVFQVAGFVAIAFLVLGIAFAFGVEHQNAARSGGSYTWVVILGAIGLALHAAMDGIALLPGIICTSPEQNMRTITIMVMRRATPTDWTDY